jgi:hypothetical protein
MIGKGKRSAELLTKILLKADLSEAGDGWSDSRVAEALMPAFRGCRDPQT